MRSIKEKLPTRQEITPVYSIILFITFTSMLFLVFWVLPSWLGDTDFMRILTMTAYVLFYALLESAVVLFGIILLAILLPARYFKDNFVAQGSALVVLISIGAYFLQKNISFIYTMRFSFVFLIPFALLAIVLLLVFILLYTFNSSEWLKALVESFAERMTVFSYIYLPLGLLCTVIVIFKIFL